MPPKRSGQSLNIGRIQKRQRLLVDDPSPEGSTAAPQERRPSNITQNDESIPETRITAQLTDLFNKAFNGADGEYIFSRQYDAPNPRLECDDTGPISLPLSAEKAERLRKVENLRSKERKVFVSIPLQNGADFTVRNGNSWNMFLQDSVIPDLEKNFAKKSTTSSLSLVPRFLLMWEASESTLGWKFKLSRKDAIGHIHIILPSPYDMELIQFRYGAQEIIWKDTECAVPNDKKVTVLAMSAGVSVETSPICSGTRLALSYDIIELQTQPATKYSSLQPTVASLNKSADKLKQLLGVWFNALPQRGSDSPPPNANVSPPLCLFPLDSYYSLEGDFMKRFSRKDRQRVLHLHGACDMDSGFGMALTTLHGWGTTLDRNEKGILPRTFRISDWANFRVDDGIGLYGQRLVWKKSASNIQKLVSDLPQKWRHRTPGKDDSSSRPSQKFETTAVIVYALDESEQDNWLTVHIDAALATSTQNFCVLTPSVATGSPASTSIDVPLHVSSPQPGRFSELSPIPPFHTSIPESEGILELRGTRIGSHINYDHLSADEFFAALQAADRSFYMEFVDRAYASKEPIFHEETLILYFLQLAPDYELTRKLSAIVIQHNLPELWNHIAASIVKGPFSLQDMFSAARIKLAWIVFTWDKIEYYLKKFCTEKGLVQCLAYLAGQSNADTSTCNVFMKVKNYVDIALQSVEHLEHSLVRPLCAMIRRHGCLFVFSRFYDRIARSHNEMALRRCAIFLQDLSVTQEVEKKVYMDMIPHIKAALSMHHNPTISETLSFRQFFYRTIVQYMIYEVGARWMPPERISCKCEYCYEVDEFLMNPYLLEGIFESPSAQTTFHFREHLIYFQDSVGFKVIAPPDPSKGHKVEIQKKRSTVTNIQATAVETENWNERTYKAVEFLRSIGSDGEIQTIMGERYDDIPRALSGAYYFTPHRVSEATMHTARYYRSHAEAPWERRA